MKNRRRTVLTQSRWLSYAAASAATALAGATGAEAEIHYSGILNAKFDAPPDGSVIHYFPLDRPGDVLAFEHIRRTPGQPSYGSAALSVQGRVSAGFAGSATFTNGTIYAYVSKLPAGALASARSFITTKSLPGYLGAGPGYPNSQWLHPGIGFVSFKFNHGAGPQYGWARVRVSGAPANTFTVIDYAWGDVGDKIRTGQKKLRGQGGSQVWATGSLGFLALGGAGLSAWRDERWRSVVPLADKD